MTALSHKTIPYPLAEWLYLSGVQYEISEEEYAWGGQAESVVPAAMPVTAKPVAIKPSTTALNLPGFIDLNAFHSYVASWKGLGLCNTATHAVTGEGVTAPQIMIVSEAPDDSEDRSGKAFSGPAHLLIRQALAAAGFDMDHVYMTYLSKWRPPGQRALGKHEMAALSALLQEEIRLVRPKALLALGESTARAIGGDSLPATGLSGKIFNIKNQWDSKNMPFLASQKAETLLKTPSMKKAFWFSLLSCTATLRAQAAPHNMESSATS